jgi:selenocysteine lyase/cysteine desulfurase
MKAGAPWMLTRRASTSMTRLERMLPATSMALLTHSCTAALEMCALLLAVRPGDEIVMPSYTFVSTANAFVLRGAVPVFVDVRVDTLNLDERLVEAAITDKTKAICAVHYAGVACEMDAILDVAVSRSSRTTRNAAWPATRAGRWAVSAPSARSASTRRRTSSPARAGPSS